MYTLIPLLLPCSQTLNPFLPYIQVRFKKASELAGTEFLDRLDYYAKAWLPGRGLVEEAIKGRTSVHPSGKIILFEQFAPWKVDL
jgi:MYG1 exonuclease